MTFWHMFRLGFAATVGALTALTLFSIVGAVIAVVVFTFRYAPL
jgi:hypothetical protein